MDVVDNESLVLQELDQFKDMCHPRRRGSKRCDVEVFKGIISISGPPCLRRLRSLLKEEYYFLSLEVAYSSKIKLSKMKYNKLYIR